MVRVVCGILVDAGSIRDPAKETTGPCECPGASPPRSAARMTEARAMCVIVSRRGRSACWTSPCAVCGRSGKCVNFP